MVRKKLVIQNNDSLLHNVHAKWDGFSYAIPTSRPP